VEAAQRHLTALGAAAPQLPPLDESRHMPMPIVSINDMNHA